MPSNTNNVKLGVCSVFFNGTDLGYTKGGVDVEVKTETKKVMVDQFGNSEVNEYITGRTCSIKIPLAETTLYNMVRVMPGAILTATGGAYATATITVVTAPGTSDTLTINGYVFSFKNTTVVQAGGPDLIDRQIGTTTTIASAIVAAINNSVSSLVSEVLAVSTGNVVTLTAVDPGTYANALAISTTSLTLSGATLAGGVNPSKVKVSVPNAIGASLLALAKALILHPLANAVNDRSADFTVPLAMTPGEVQFSFKLDEERTFPLTFTAYPNPATGVLFVVGDNSTV